MKGKISTVIISLFLLQLATSCFIFDCDMEGTVIEIQYNSFTLTTWDTVNQSELQIDQTTSKNSFELQVLIDRKTTHLSSLIKRNNSFGFNSAYACSEPEISVRYKDPIDLAKILVQDTETLITIDVTTNFESLKYKEHEFNTLDELIKFYASETFYNIDQNEPLRMTLTNIENIPDYAVFTINIDLESGIGFTEHTNQINFRQ
jgi:hypothetical protein